MDEIIVKVVLTAIAAAKRNESEQTSLPNEFVEQLDLLDNRKPIFVQFFDSISITLLNGSK